MHCPAVLIVFTLQSAMCACASEGIDEKNNPNLEEYFTKAAVRWTTDVREYGLPSTASSDLGRSRRLVEETLWSVASNEDVNIDRRCDAVAAIGRVGPNATILRLANNVLKLRRVVLDHSSLLYAYPCAGALLEGGSEAMPALLTADVSVASDDEQKVLTEIRVQVIETFFSRMCPSSPNYRLLAIRYLECLECAEWQRPQIAAVLSRLQERHKEDTKAK